MEKLIFASLSVVLALETFARGEGWLAKPSAPPPVATLTNEARYIKWKFREDVTDPSTGLATAALKAKVEVLRKELEPKEDWRVVKAKSFALVCDEMAIDVSPLDWYPAIAVWNRYDRPLDYFKGGRQGPISAKYYPEERRKMDEGNASGKWKLWVDFDHSVPVWEELIADGFTGALKNVAASDDGSAFYASLKITANACLRLVDRFIAQGERNLVKEAVAKPGRDGVPSPSAAGGGTPALPKTQGFANSLKAKGEGDEMVGRDPRARRLEREIAALRQHGAISVGRDHRARRLEREIAALRQHGAISVGRDHRARRLEREIAALRQLRVGPPKTAYETMLFIDLYFFMCEHLDVMQCRSLTIIDRTLWPFYKADLAAGRTTEAEFREQFKHFLWQWGSVDNYWGQPITIGGTKADGTTEYNPLSLVILDVMDECNLPTPKFHVKIGRSTPRPVLDKLLDMVRRHRSLTFIGEETARKILADWGYAPEETVGFYTKGCYEICVPNGANSTGTGYVNLLKQIEWTLGDAADGKFRADTYEAFLAECTRRMAAVCREAREIASKFERHLDDVNPANVSTLGVRYAIRVKKDAFANGSERGNNTGIQISAIGTCADACVAVKEIVYERHEMTLAELGKLMAANWKGREDLRLRMKRSKRKYGNNDPDANAAAVRMQDAIAAEINHKPNARGGVYGLVGHTARAFIYSGGETGATPDGRKAGEQFSKNMSATMGADTEGVTALVDTLGALDSSKWPGDFPLDVMLHPSTVAGERGLETMRTLLSVYFAKGGLQIQFNVVSPEELRDAQKHPEKYENLQVRVCGWNVRWNDMPKYEQDEYILRAERIQR